MIQLVEGLVRALHLSIRNTMRQDALELKGNLDRTVATWMQAAQFTKHATVVRRKWTVPSMDAMRVRR